MNPAPIITSLVLTGSMAAVLSAAFSLLPRLDSRTDKTKNILLTFIVYIAGHHLLSGLPENPFDIMNLPTEHWNLITVTAFTVVSFILLKSPRVIVDETLRLIVLLASAVGILWQPLISQMWSTVITLAVLGGSALSFWVMTLAEKREAASPGCQLPLKQLSLTLVVTVLLAVSSSMTLALLSAVFTAILTAVLLLHYLFERVMKQLRVNTDFGHGIIVPVMLLFLLQGTFFADIPVVSAVLAVAGYTLSFIYLSGHSVLRSVIPAAVYISAVVIAAVINF